jgi:hypothetical protein
MRRTTTRTAVAAVAVVLLGAGCAAGHGSGRQVSTLAASRRPASLGPQTISSRQAGGLARSLLARALLPRGAKVRQGRAPAALNQPAGIEGGRPSIELHRLWTVAEPASAVYRFWQGHAPQGMTWTGSGQSSDRGGVIQESTSYGFKRRLPAGVDAEMLNMSVVPASQHTSVIRADVQVIWYPPRSAAEYIPPGTRAVTITASATALQTGSRPHSVTKAITARSVVRRLATMLNGVYAAPRGAVYSCPLEAVTYRLAFAKSAGAAPFLVATDTNCTGVGITVGGHQQPELEAPASLQKLVESLTGIGSGSLPMPSGTPRHMTTVPARYTSLPGVFG